MENEMKHTEGPWHVGEIIQAEPGGGKQTIEVCHYEMFGSQKREYVIAHVFCSEADTRLIAAAPELLEGCKALLAAMIDYEMDVNDEKPYKHIKMMKQARAAIAKATK
jgi:hypothetical protein